MTDRSVSADLFAAPSGTLQVMKATEERLYRDGRKRASLMLVVRGPADDAVRSRK
jgi:hypothetical protein